MNGEIAPLASLLDYTRDGEWGSGEPTDGFVPMRVIRGTDFEHVRRGEIASVPTRYIRADIAARKALHPWDILIETAGGSKTDQPDVPCWFTRVSWRAWEVRVLVRVSLGSFE